MLMRSIVFPYGVTLKSILNSLIFIYPNLNYYRHSIFILLIVEPTTMLSVRNENQSLALDVVTPFFIFVFKIFHEILKFTRSF